MVKALFLYSDPSTSIPTGSELPVIGGGTVGTIDADAHITIPVAGTLSRLAHYNLGGTGTNTVQLRKNAANGNEVIAATGTGFKEDASNTDSISANDEVNFALTDTGTNPTYSYHRLLWEASGDNCTLIFATTPTERLCDSTSDRYSGFRGSMATDWSSPETDQQIKIRTPGTASHFQINIYTNLAGISRIFRFRKNGGDGNQVLTITAGATGIAIDTSNTDAIADGDLVCADLQGASNVHDIAPASVGFLLTNTATAENEVWAGCSTANAGIGRTASATAHFRTLGGCWSTTFETNSALRAVKPGFAGVARNLRIYLSANTYTANATFKLKNLTAATEISVTLTASGGAGWYENTSDTLSFAATDDLVYEFLGGTANTITIQSMGVTLSETVAYTLFSQILM